MSVSPVVGQPPILIMHSIFMDISQTNWDAHPSSLMNSHKFFWIPMFNGMNETYQETMTLEPPKYGELFEYLKFYLYPQSPVLHPPPKIPFSTDPPTFWRNRSLRSRWKMRWSERSTAPRSTGY